MKLVRDRSFYKQMLKIVLPIALQNLISQMVSMADTLMLGQLPNSGDKISGVSTANQIFFIFNLFMFGLSAGAAVLCAQYWGKGNKQAVRQVMAITMRIAFAIGLLFFALIWLIPEQLLRIYTDDPAVIENGLAYLRLVSPIYLTFSLSGEYMMCVRAAKNVRISTIVYMISLGINIFFNWVFIFGKLGAPALDVRGAAIGTLIARGTEFLIIAVYTSCVEKQIGFRPKDLLGRNPVLLRDFVRYATPVVFNEFLWGLGTSMTVALLGRLGSAVITANTIASNISQMLTVLLFGVASSAAVLVGNQIGEGKIAYAKECAFTYEIISLILGVFLSGVILVTRPFALSLFQVEPGVLQDAWDFLLVLALVAPFQSYNCTGIVGLLRSGGDTRFGFFCDVFGLWAYAIPIGALLIFVFHCSPFWVYLAMRGDELLKCFFVFFRLRSDCWMGEITRDAVALEQPAQE